MTEVTDSQGHFVFSGMAQGEYTLSFTRLGYASREEIVEIGTAQRLEVSLALATEPIELEPIEVEVGKRSVRLELSGFYERREFGHGQFLSVDQIERRTIPKATELFNDFRGMRFINHQAEDGLVEEAVAFTRGQGVTGFSGDKRICYPAVYVDDFPISTGGSEPALINRRLTPEDIAGIEVYTSAAQVPVKYSGTGRACGLVLIWTRG